MIKQGFFLQSQSGAAQWPRTSKMQRACAAPNLIRTKYPFKIILLGIKSLEKRPVLSRIGHFFSEFDIYLCKMTIPTSTKDCFCIFYTLIIQHWKIIFGLNLELHKIFAFLRLEATVQRQIEAAGKILSLSFTLGVRSIENCCKKVTLKNLTIPFKENY